MTNQDFKTALRDLGWTQARTAQELDLSLRTIGRYAAGTTPVPRTVALILAARLKRRR